MVFLLNPLRPLAREGTKQGKQWTGLKRAVIELGPDIIG